MIESTFIGGDCVVFGRLKGNHYESWRVKLRTCLHTPYMLVGGWQNWVLIQFPRSEIHLNILLFIYYLHKFQFFSIRYGNVRYSPLNFIDLQGRIIVGARENIQVGVAALQNEFMFGVHYDILVVFRKTQNMF